MTSFISNVQVCGCRDGGAAARATPRRRSGRPGTRRTRGSGRGCGSSRAPSPVSRPRCPGSRPTPSSPSWTRSASPPPTSRTSGGSSAPRSHSPPSRTPSASAGRSQSRRVRWWPSARAKTPRPSTTSATPAPTPSHRSAETTTVNLQFYLEQHVPTNHFPPKDYFRRTH